MRYAFALLFLIGCGEPPHDGQFIPLDAHEMNPGARLTLAHFVATDGAMVRFAVIGSNLQPLAVGVAYEGPPATPETHHSYAWLGASQADPYADATPAPLVAGQYRVELGCGEEATIPCVFSFEAWIDH